MFRQYGKAGIVLASRAAMLLIVAVTGLLHQDMRDGLATVQANRREYRLMPECEIAVTTLALASLRWQQKLFWLAGRFMRG